MVRFLLVVVAFSSACGSAPEEAQGPDPCKLAQKELASRLGPEFDRVVTGRRLALAAPGGCALVYLQKDEELAGEVSVEGGGLAVVDQMLAVALPDSSGKLMLTLVGASPMAPGAVLLTLDGKDVDGDGTAELVVQEAGGDYQGLRLFLLPGGASEPIEIFSEALRVKTPEGLEISAQWSLGTHDKNPAIVLDGAGTKKIFGWDRSQKKFTFNEAATNAARPKVEVPVAPVPEAPVTEAPVEVKAGKKGKEKKVVEKKKPVEKKKVVEKAPEPKEEKAPDAPLGLPDLGL